jgi:formylglycine-generating enzyme
MSRAEHPDALLSATLRLCGLFLILALAGCQPEPKIAAAAASDAPAEVDVDPFHGSQAGEERELAGLKLCWCPLGKFTMGSPKSEPERRPGEDQVAVTLSHGFWMSKYEATQGDWKRIVGQLPGELTAELPEGDDYPLGNVNFAEAQTFCRKLTELAHELDELPQAWEFRLPTEAQWEYACRAGTTTATSFGDKLSSKQANFKGKPYNGGEAGPSLGKAATVGSYPANAWGLHDMHGNTFEWCRDWYHHNLPGGVDPDLHDAKTTATRSENGDISRVRRGGCWADEGWPCRSAFRLRFEPERRYDHIGFRVVAVKR